MNSAIDNVTFSELELPLQELAESPLWHEDSFYWCNITEGEVWKWTAPGRSYKAFPTLVVKASSMVGGFFFDNHKRLILMTERGLEFYTGKECRMIMLTSAAFGAADLSKGISADGDFLGGKIYTA